jgi:hypothetical protein
LSYHIKSRPLHFKNNDNAVGIINDLSANYGSVNDQSEAETYANQLSLANVSLNNPNYTVATTSNLGDIIIPPIFNKADTKTYHKVVFSN